MTDKERINWLFIEFMKMESRAERAEEKIKDLQKPLQISIATAAKNRRHRGGPKRKP